MLTTLDSCEQKFYYEYIHHLAPLAISPDLHAGGAFAHGIDASRRSLWIGKNDTDQAILDGQRALIEYWKDFEPPHNHPKTCEAMLMALEYYFREAFPPETDHIKPVMLAGNLPATEFSFALPMDVKHPITGDPIIFAGRFDLLGTYEDSLLCIVDEKTTKSLGPRWGEQWDLRGQFLGYTFAAQQYGYACEMAVIRGISILKTRFDHTEVIVQHPQWQIERWWEQAHEKVRRAVAKWESGEWNYSYGEACTAYAGCVFKTMCLSMDPMREMTQYQKRYWNPLRQNPTEPKDGAKFENIGNIDDLLT